ncbi:MAG: CYTH domain-containing protein [Chlorobi bacterium]|nr:CYTH domain-containing protein [Chlorobiota bacterium]
MNREIERKFLVLNKDFLQNSEKSEKIIQGYLSRDPERTVRVRIKDDKGFLTVKGKSEGISRFEYEIEIKKEDALQLINICLPEIIHKTRYYVPYGNHVFETDVFEGKNEGLILCETELKSEDEDFEKPEWLGKEVSNDKRYYNSYLSQHPYGKQNTDIQKITSEVTEKMISYFGKDAKRINHALKVFSYANIIAEHENISDEKKLIISITALLHDTGIKVCEKKYGFSTGKCQEKEGPDAAKKILSDTVLPEKTLNRILFIIGNHHTYSKIDDIDFRIQAEADFLVNFEEGNEPKSIIPKVKKNIFKTEYGLFLLENIF